MSGGRRKEPFHFCFFGVFFFVCYTNIRLAPPLFGG